MLDRYTRRSFAPPPGFSGLASSTFDLTNNLRQAEAFVPDKTDNPAKKPCFVKPIDI
jgi:hypothetical protein